MSTLNEQITRLETAKTNIDNVLVSRGVSIPNNAKLDTYHELINSIKGGTSSEEVTATKANVLAGTTTITSDSNDEIVEGTMPNNGAVAPSALGAGGSYTIPAGYHNGSGKVTVQSLATMTASGDATAAQILSGKKAYVDGSLLTGTMADQGAKTSSLNCGGSYTIPAGYHNGSGKITANSLSSQTSANATAAQILKDKTAWVNGSKLTGSLAVTSAISFSAAARSSSVIRISWTNPSKGPWSGVKIRYSTSGYPGVSGGTLTYTGTGSSTTAGGSSYVDITGLSMGTTYYFTCYSYATGLGDSSTGYNCSDTTKGLLIYNYGSNPGGVYSDSVAVTFNSDHIACKESTFLKTTTYYSVNNYTKMGMILNKDSYNSKYKYPMLGLQVISDSQSKNGSTKLTSPTVTGTGLYTFEFPIPSVSYPDSGYLNFQYRTLNLNNYSQSNAYIKIYKIWFE